MRATRAAAALALAVAAAAGLAAAQYDVDPFHPTYTTEEVSDAQGECMRLCIEKKPRPQAGCLSELGMKGQWGCELAFPEERKYDHCKNQMRNIQVSSLDCECIKTSAGNCVSAFEIMQDVWSNVPLRYKQAPRIRAQE